MNNQNDNNNIPNPKKKARIPPNLQQNLQSKIIKGSKALAFLFLIAGIGGYYRYILNPITKAEQYRLQQKMKKEQNIVKKQGLEILKQKYALKKSQ